MGQTDILTLKGKFTACQKMLTVFGDEVRQRLLLLMLEGDPNGVRVADISDKMKLTPPAVSHHMQILKDAGVVHCRKESICTIFWTPAERTSTSCWNCSRR